MPDAQHWTDLSSVPLLTGHVPCRGLGHQANGIVTRDGTKDGSPLVESADVGHILCHNLLFKGLEQPRDQTCISCVFCIGRQVLYHLGSPHILFPPALIKKGCQPQASIVIPLNFLLATDHQVGKISFQDHVQPNTEGPFPVHGRD